MKLAPLALVVSLFLAGPATPQIIGKRTDSSCIDLRENRLTVSGLLKLESFAGPPNYESVEGGDVEEMALMIELPDIDCVDDHPGAEVGDSELFLDVHVYSSNDAVLDKLNELVGQTVAIDGDAFSAHTAHHRAPLVIDATQVTEID